MPISRSLKEATEAAGRVGPKLIVGEGGDERGISLTVCASGRPLEPTCLVY